MSLPIEPDQANLHRGNDQAPGRRDFLKRTGASAAALGLLSTAGTAIFAASQKANTDMSNDAHNKAPISTQPGWPSTATSWAQSTAMP